MKILLVVFVGSYMLISAISYSQNGSITMNQGVKDIVKLGSDSIVQLALTKIDRNASLENFAKTSIQTNGEEVLVVFSNPIIYLPLNSVYYSTVGVNLSTDSKFSSKVANPVDYKNNENTPYYTETSESKQNLEFVINAIENMDTSDMVNYQGSNLIREKEEYYEVSVVSESQESWYKIKKLTGEVYDEGHAHLEPVPYSDNKEDAFKEISFSK